MLNIPHGARNVILGGLSFAAIAAPGAAKNLPSTPRIERTQEPDPQSAAQPASVESTIVKPAQVTYQDGQLTIIAENTPLSEVMKALRVALGAEFDLPPSAAGQHIWVHLGPGPARRVLRDLLDGTEFNYVIQAADNDEDGIRSILLTQRSKAGSPVGASSAPEIAGSRRSIRGINGATATATEGTDAENPATAEAAAAAPGPTNGTPSAPTTNDHDQAVASANAQTAAGNSDEDSSKNASRSDQMIQQLQSLYQQRRQIQAQQNQKSSTPTPN